MMSNRHQDILFQLVHSLEKSEKRNFSLYIKRSSSKADLKVLQLFNAISALPEYDEKILLKKLVTVEKPQLANLKTHLYRQLLASLRLLKSAGSIELLLNEQIDSARILYNKGLYLQSLKILERAKDLAAAHYQDNFLLQIISLEKKIETLHITRSVKDRADQLEAEANVINERRTSITRLSNLALQLYSWYIRHGHARNQMDEAAVRKFFRASLPNEHAQLTSFYERMYLFQSYCWYAFIRQDFLMYYRYSRKWVSLFHDEKKMIPVETGHYIKGFHTLLNAHFDLRNFRAFRETLAVFEAFANSEAANLHDTFRVTSFVYIYSARLNWHLMTGTFTEGLLLVPAVEERLEEYSRYIDRHRVLVFNYKIASLYFGNGDFKVSIDYLHKIINDPSDLRTDLQCYARLLHLIAHYELGNEEILESLIKSVYRFMARMHNLTLIEEEVFKFLRKSFYVSLETLKPELEIFLKQVKRFEKDRFETRSFAYLDVISWLESKVHQRPMNEILYRKYLDSNRR